MPPPLSPLPLPPVPLLLLPALELEEEELEEEEYDLNFEAPAKKSKGRGFSTRPSSDEKKGKGKEEGCHPPF